MANRMAYGVRHGRAHCYAFATTGKTARTPYWPKVAAGHRARPILAILPRGLGIRSERIGTSSFVTVHTCPNGRMGTRSSSYVHKQRPLTTLSDARLEVARLYHAMMRGTLDKKMYYAGSHGLKAWSALYEQDVLEQDQRAIMERAGMQPPSDDLFAEDARITH